MLENFPPEPQDSATYKEILSQAAARCEAIEITDGKAAEIKSMEPGSYKQVLYIGCGSTYYLSLAAAKLFQSMTGVMARAAPSSELLLFSETLLVEGKVLLIAISPSGTTSETVRAARDFRERDLGNVIVITNNTESPLAELADLSIGINAGKEL
jgi:glucosamine--fructose-6-phosphate aminotransferase (isomerizing)